MKQKFNELSIKEKLGFITAALAFAFGWLITIVAAFVPILLSEQGVLFILGEGMIYCGSFIGISMYFRSEQHQLKTELKRYFNKQERLLDERNKLRDGIDVDEIPDDKEGDDE
jgi:positive regulator of sigma E activity